MSEHWMYICVCVCVCLCTAKERKYTLSVILANSTILFSLPLLFSQCCFIENQKNDAMDLT